MLSRVFTSSALLMAPSRVAHALNAIGLSAKVASIFGVNPMFLVNVSRVGFESAGTCSGFRAAVLTIVVSVTYCFYEKILRVRAHRLPAGAASTAIFPEDRTGRVEVKGVSISVDLVGCVLIKKT